MSAPPIGTAIPSITHLVTEIDPSEDSKKFIQESPQNLIYPFFTPELYNFLTENHYLKDGKLTKAITLPSISTLQNDTLFGLIDSPFDLTDHNQICVLKNLSCRKVLDLLMQSPLAKKSNCILECHVAGGSVTPILESDPLWLKKVVQLIVSDEQFSGIEQFIRPFSTRNLPDIDIHLYCNKNSYTTRKEILEQLINALADLVIEENSAYVYAEMARILTISSKQKSAEPNLRSVLDCIKIYQNAKRENGSPELLNICFKSAVVEILKQNCLKKFPKETTLIAFGKIEIYLCEDPSYLLTPDRITLKFELPRRTSCLAPATFSCTNSLIHKICKVAYIDKDPSEFTLLKASSYIALGTHVIPDENFKISITKFVDFVYSKLTRKLTHSGEILFARYLKSHFLENPQEGLCTLFALFQILKNQHKELIPQIVKICNNFLRIDFKDQKLNKLKDALNKCPQNFDLIENIFTLLSFSKEHFGTKLIYFEHEGKILPYLIKIFIKQKDAIQTLLQADINSVSDVTKILFSSKVEQANYLDRIVVEELEKNLDNLNPSFSVFVYLLNTPHPEKYFNYLPCTYNALNDEDKIYLLDLVKNRFGNEKLSAILCEPTCTSLYLFTLGLAKIPEFAETAYFFWLNNFSKLPAESLAVAQSFLPKREILAFKIIQRSLLLEYSVLHFEFQDCVYDTLTAKLNSDSNIELHGMFPNITTWLIFCYTQRQAPEKVKKLTTFKLDLKSLSKYSISYWSYLNEKQIVECIKFVAITNLKGYSEGLQFFSSLETSEDSKLQVIQTLPSVISNYLNPNIEVIPLFNAIIKLFQTKWSDQKIRAILPLLFSFYLDCKTAHKKSKSILFLTYLKSSALLLLSYDFDMLMQSEIPPVNLSYELCYLLKNENKLLQDNVKSINENILKLIAILSAENKVGVIEELISVVVSTIPSLSNDPAIIAWKTKFDANQPEQPSISKKVTWKTKGERNRWVEANWCKEVIAKTYGNLTRTEIIECFGVYFSIKQKILSKEVFKILPDRYLVFTFFEDHFALDEAVNIYIQWFKKICSTLVNPDLLESTEIDLMQNFKLDILAKIKDSGLPSLENEVNKTFIQFFSVSEDSEILLTCWEWAQRNLINKDNILERKEIIEIILRNILERCHYLAELELLEEDKICIASCSGEYFKTFQERNIPPELWLEGFINLKCSYLTSEILAWAIIVYRKEKVSDRCVKTIQTYICHLFKKPQKLTDHSLSCLGQLLQLIDTHNHSKDAPNWKKYIQILLDTFYSKFTEQSVTNLCIHWKYVHEFRILKDDLLLKPEYITRIFDLLAREYYHEFGFLWNHLYINFFHFDKRSLQFLYSDKDCDLPVIHFPANFTNFNVITLSQYTGEIYKILDYTNRLLVCINLSDKIRSYLYDISFTALRELIFIHIKKFKVMKKDILTFFERFLNVVKMKEEKAFKTHITVALPSILQFLTLSNIDIENEEIFYDCFVRIGCKDGFKNVSASKFKVSAEVLLSEKYDLETGILPVDTILSIMQYFIKIDSTTYKDFDELFQLFLNKFLKITESLLFNNKSFEEMTPIFNAFINLMCLPTHLTNEGILNRAKYMNAFLEDYAKYKNSMKEALNLCLNLSIEKGFYKSHPNLLQEAQNLLH